MAESASARLELPRSAYDWKKLSILLAGLAVFLAVFFMPAWPDAIDPAGKIFSLSPEGKAAIGVFQIGRAHV